MYTKWNKNKLNEQIDKIAIMHAEHPSLKYERDLDSLCRLVNNKSKLFEQEGKFSDQIMYDKALLYKNRAFVDNIHTFAEQSDLLSFKNIELINTWEIQNKYLISFLHDFYNSIDRDLAKIFNKIFKEKKNNLRLTRKNMEGYDRNYSTYIKSLDYAYFNIALTDTVDDFLSLVHEYAHAIADYMHFRPSYSSYPFIELLPLLMERLASDKLVEYFMDLEKEIYLLNWLSDKKIIQYAQEISIQDKCLSLFNNNDTRKNYISNISHYTGDTKSKSERLLNSSLEEKLAYTIPYLTMIEFYDLYYKDPAQCLYIIKNLITLTGEDYYKFLTNNNIILNEHSKEFIEEDKEKIRLAHYM